MTDATQATYVRTETVPLNQLHPFPGNAKRGDVPLILDSLRVNGQYRGLVVRLAEGSPLTVLAGNHTAQALDLHGAGPCGRPVRIAGEERPCGICHGLPWEPSARCEIIACDDATALAVNLVDNRASEKGTYDRGALAELLSYAEDLGYAGTGYTEQDVQLLIAPPLSVEQLEHYRSPEAADDALWPLLKLRISPTDRDAFYGLTIDCADLNDDAARFRYLLDRAKAAPPITG
ncbi:hypothetical protein ACFY0G_02230 [Streptomyces sp. NPDC001552]|uniref:hypothetical protein n=1 Tax=Streptomyces sp. NPDC001552 TaxID=3364587 RepID=UPI0036CCDB96